MELYEVAVMIKLFFDLDGTLLDSKQRLYELFQHLVPESDFNFETYWNFKKNKIDHSHILSSNFNYNTEMIESFQQQWLSLIETDEWLNYDKPFDNVTEFLHLLKEEHEIFLVTARQSEIKVTEQIEKFGWHDIFTAVLVTSHRTEKDNLIRHYHPSANDWLIGDTGYDIKTGKLLGMRTAAVLTGFLNQERLMEYNPDIIAASVLDLHFN